MAEKEDKTPELEPVGPGAEMEPEDQTVRDVDGEDIREDDEEGGARAHRDEDDDQDERVAHSEDDEEEGGEDRERIRVRRRAERKQKKEEQRRAQRELSFLRQRNEVLERRQSEFDARIVNSEVVTIDTRIQGLQSDIQKADDIYAEAISKGDGAAAAEAQRIRDQLRDGVNKLQGVRQATINGARERLQPQNKPDPEIQRRAQEFIADNSDWYDHEGGNEDSVIAKAIEGRLFKERGPDAAKTDEYWDEYKRRLKKRLPHLFERNRDERDDDRNDRYEETDDRDIDGHNRRAAKSREPDDLDERPTKRKGGGPRFTSGGRERPLKKNEVYVSEERRKALEEAGVWDDPVLRNRYLKSYQNYDAAARRDRR